MDIGDTIAPNSDQLDAIDLRASGPRTFTVARVVVGGGDQPVNVHLAEFPRPWRPGLSMRRVLDGLWGPSAGGAYEGRRITLYCDDRVKFGGEAVGGVRISHMSHIGDRKRGVSLIVSRGVVKVYEVQPLQEGPDRVTEAQLGQIAEHLKRTGLSKTAALTLATDVAGRTIGKATELTTTEAYALLVTLGDTPDAGEE